MRRLPPVTTGLLVGCLAAGAAAALLWSAVAPAAQFRVLPDGAYGPLPTHWTYPFTSIAILVLLGIVVGVTVGTVAWRVRSQRGPAMVWVVLGANAAGALTTWMAARLLRDGVEPSTVGATGADLVVTAPPMTGSLLVTVAQPAFAVAAYTVLVGFDGRPGLGREPDGRSGGAAADDPMTEPIPRIVSAAPIMTGPAPMTPPPGATSAPEPTARTMPAPTAEPLPLPARAPTQIATQVPSQEPVPVPPVAGTPRTGP